MISPSLIEQIRLANDIVEVIESYLPLKKSGGGFFALCPFHKEKTPSFYVNPQRQIFHCFGCHKGGNVFTFLMEYENLTFIEAVKQLAERVHIQIQFDAASIPQKREKDLLYEIHEQITQRWHNCLLNESSGEVAREYLKKRGVSEEAIKIFRLGYAPDLWDDTLNWGVSKGYSAEVLEKAGIVKKSDDNKKYYDKFRGRLIFPICYEQGKVIAFSGRTLVEGENTAKYLNSPETPIFIKSKIFYGLDKSKKAILNEKFAIICEGQLDLISCYMAGIRNVVAPQGTAFTHQHAAILKRYTDEAVLCFDSDDPGQEATIRAAPILFSNNIAVRVAVVPDPDDPDSFIKNYGAEKFKEIIQKANGFYDYFLERLCNLNNPATDKGKMTIIKEFGVALKRSNNAVIVDTYKNRLAGRLAVNPIAMEEELKKLPSQIQPGDFSEDTLQRKETSLNNDELWLLKIILQYEETVSILNEYLNTEWLQDDRIRKIIEKRLSTEIEWMGISQFIENFEEPELAGLITGIAIESESIPLPEKQVFDILLKLRNKFIEQKIVQIKMKLNNNAIDDNTRDELIYEKIKLDKQKKLSLEKIEK